MDQVFRLFSSLAGVPAGGRREENNEDEGLRELQARLGAASIAGGGARAARQLRGPPGDHEMLVISMSDRGLQLGMPGSAFPGMMVGEDALPGMAFPGMTMPFGGPFGPSSMQEAAMRNVMGNVMQAMMEHIAQAVVERSVEDTQPSVPPANESARDALPKVIVTKEDLIDNNNSHCCVCMEDYKAGARATRMFCGHLFCTTCIREWLRTANSCPVCRFELPTDSPEYEAGRTDRMRERVARFKEGELKSMRVPDLRRVMVALGVPSVGCVEKAELISRLGATPGVEVVADRKDVFYEDSDLSSLDLPLLRSLLERHRVPPLGAGCSSSSAMGPEDDEERDELLQRFAIAGMLGKAAQMAAEIALAEDATKADEREDHCPTADEGSQICDETEPPPPPPVSPPPTKAEAEEKNAGSEVDEPEPAPSSSASPAPRKAARKKSGSSTPRRSLSSTSRGSSSSQIETRSTPAVPSRPANPSPAVARPRAKRRSANSTSAQ